MLYYHYSAEGFPELKSLVAQGRKGRNSDVERSTLTVLENKIQQILDKLVLKGEHSYDRHVSLFLEPIPLNLPEIFEHKHEFWISGLKLIEHIVLLEDIPENISFSLEESPEKTHLLYKKQDWTLVKEKTELIAEFKKEIVESQKKHGYIGHGKNSMIKACGRFTTGIERYYRESAKIAKQYPEDGGYSKYAACVPHLMIYPGYKSIKVHSHREIVLH